MSNLLVKSDRYINDKLVNKLKHLLLTKIDQKTVWSLILTSNQRGTPMEYSICIPSVSIWPIFP